MSSHDIIDNRSEKLTEHINAILKSSERAKFAVGYFFLSGFEAVQDYLKIVKDKVYGKKTADAKAGSC